MIAYNPDKDDLHYQKKVFRPVFDSQGRLSLQHLFHVFQDTATDWIERLDVGRRFQEENHFLYVVLRYKAWFLKEFEKEKDYTLVTYPIKAGGVSMYRYAYVLDKNSEVLFYLSSLWVMVDATTRRIRSTRFFNETILRKIPDFFEMKPFVEEKLENFPLDEETFTFVKDYVVRKEDIDSNGHMNNTVYFALVSDILPDVSIKSLEMDYEKECFLKEEISLFLSRKDTYYVIKGEKKNRELSFKCKITLK